MKIVFTTAPEDYDYSQAETLEEFEYTMRGGSYSKKWRKVKIDADEYRTTYQLNRYGSGLHPILDEDPRKTNF